MDWHIGTLLPSEAEACEAILRSLPDWFGIEAAIASYRRDIERMDTRVARIADGVAGFITVRLHNQRSAEIQVMAVRRGCHRNGIGRALVGHVEQGLRGRGVGLLHVKTLGPSQPAASYARTRLFYEAMGFIPLEETTAIWGDESPCLIMVKSL